MGRSYQIVESKERGKVRDFLVKEEQCLAGFVDVVEQARMGLNELVELVGRMGLEAVLALSAQGVAGAKRTKATKGMRGGSGRERADWNPRHDSP